MAKGRATLPFQTEAGDGEEVVVCPLRPPKISKGQGKGCSSQLAQGRRGLWVQLQFLTPGLVVSGRGRAGRGCSVLQAYLGMGGHFGPTSGSGQSGEVPGLGMVQVYHTLPEGAPPRAGEAGSVLLQCPEFGQAPGPQRRRVPLHPWALGWSLGSRATHSGCLFCGHHDLHAEARLLGCCVERRRGTWL